MTFLNRRIIQQPTLFASSRRNFGNLLEKYETDQTSTSGSGRQLTSIHPEPTFTTSWTKSGLSITADLLSIAGAHPEFYAYLCRDDETTLATHQFTEGQTTTSLSFTETEYGTFTYQLKLGTAVVSSHTETYVRPTPTYTASFSTNELTLSASITSITNAHNSFAITLERDDGTVLQTHTLADGETSFTFTQTETSYATFNYVLKLSGTQTDTYSAGYTPPPTPTFDIALTNEDLAITATLTDIVNPDPYYTVSFYDSSSQVASHTFSTNETGVVLNWNETTYGTKAYTIEINGASHSSHNIQQPEDSYFRYIGYIDLLNDYTQGSYDFNDPYGEIRFRNNCKIRMKNNSVETLVPFTQTSDGRAKTNKEGIRSGLDAVLRLKPQTYEKHGKTESGFITQEVLEIPELKHSVNVPENENELQSLNYTGIISYLVSAIQELNNKLN